MSEKEICKALCGHFRNGMCCVDNDWPKEPPICETLEWDQLEAMAKYAMECEADI